MQAPAPDLCVLASVLDRVVHSRISLSRVHCLKADLALPLVLAMLRLLSLSLIASPPGNIHQYSYEGHKLYGLF